MKSILIFGKGSSGKAVKNFCNKKGIKSFLVDDTDYNPEILGKIDTIVVSPGVPFYHKIFKDAKKNKKEIIGEIEFAYRFLDKKNKIIAITGTDGKSTTSKLTYHILEGKYHTYLCGNYGIPFIDIIEKANTQPGFIVIELSSFQIYSVKTFSPDIAVFLNFSPDHLDWHKKLSHYFLTKQKLFKKLRKSSLAILNLDDRCVKNVDTNGKKVFFSEKKETDITIKKNEFFFKYKNKTISFKNENKMLLGTHNTKNMAVASYIGYISGIDTESIKGRLDSFKPLPYRLEYIKDIKGISVFNDAKSTTPQALENALLSFNKPVILIAGGINKGGDFKKLKPILKKKVKKVILIGKSKDEIKNMIYGSCEIETGSSLEEAVRKAFNCAEKGDIILFSPGCASFDMFKNYIDRGEKFKKIVEKIDG